MGTLGVTLNGVSSPNGLREVAGIGGRSPWLTEEFQPKQADRSLFFLSA